MQGLVWIVGAGTIGDWTKSKKGEKTMSNEPKKRKRGNPNLKRGQRNPYHEKAIEGRWGKNKLKELGESQSELGQDVSQISTEPPLVA